MTWAGFVGICAAVSNALAYVTGALPHSYAQWFSLAGVGVIAIDRFATAMENVAYVRKTPTVPKAKGG